MFPLDGLADVMRWGILAMVGIGGTVFLLAGFYWFSRRRYRLRGE